ncbi:MAG: hypothetical protein HRT35_16225 [Algicola sp.]|nr:hypothetical protein [Algicola sp.]
MQIVTKVIVAFAFISSTAFASGSINKDTIDAVAFNTGGFFLYANGWGNPNNCTQSGAIVLQTSDTNYDKAYALLLAAYASGKKVSGYSDRCVTFDGQTYNMIRGFKYLMVSDK